MAPADRPPNRCTVRAIRPTRPLALVDASAPTDVLALVERLASTCEVVLVRLRWENSLESLRYRLLERAPSAMVGVPGFAQDEHQSNGSVLF
jgi:hypothetical protein